MCLLPLINRHLAQTGQSATRFGRLALNDPRFVQDLRRGREPRPATIAKIRAFVAAASAR